MRVPNQPIRHVFAMMALLIFCLVPVLGQASEVERLASVMPDDNKVVIGVDMNSLRASPFYKDGYEWFKNHPTLGSLLQLLEDEGSFDINKDLHALMLVTSDLPTSVDGANAMPFGLAISGTFNQEELLKAAKERFADAVERKEGKITVHRSEEVEFGFANATTLIVGSGEGAFLKKLWTSVADAKKTRNANFMSLKKDVGASQNVWVLLDTREAQQSEGPKSEMAGIGIRLNPGLELTVLTRMATEEDAQEAAMEAEKLKAGAGADPMVALFGLAPLVQNLKVAQKAKEMRMTTSMTEGQTRALVTRVQAIAKRSGTLQGGAMPTIQRPTPTTPEDGEKKTPTGPGQGVPADFN
ncbi:MAG: hypothetical protein ACNA8W_06120 [Bradymonadaceae bacterium]